MKFVNWMLGTMGMMLAVIAVYTIGPILETQFFPVYSKVKIVEVIPDATGVNVKIQITKYRSCSPPRYAWSIGSSPLSRRELYITPLGPYTTGERSLGTTITTSVHLADVSPLDLVNLYAEVYSNCHPLWITRTIVLP